VYIESFILQPHPAHNELTRPSIIQRKRPHVDEFISISLILHAVIQENVNKPSIAWTPAPIVSKERTWATRSRSDTFLSSVGPNTLHKNISIQSSRRREIRSKDATGRERCVLCKGQPASKFSTARRSSCPIWLLFSFFDCSTSIFDRIITIRDHDIHYRNHGTGNSVIWRTGSLRSGETVHCFFDAIGYIFYLSIWFASGKDHIAPPIYIIYKYIYIHIHTHHKRWHQMSWKQ